jgi:uncharacterized protein (TIGR00290 family)
VRAPGDLRDVPVFCSWSGGKDSALALHEAIEAGAEPRFLASMMIESGERSRSHGLSRDLLAAQAEALGLPIRFGAASWDDYGDEMARVLAAGVEEHGTPVGVFGDIDVEGHREWVEATAARADAEACLPLWQRDRGEVVDSVLAAGFRAAIVAVRDDALSPDLLGRTVDAALVDEVVAAGADPAGEYGEFHTVVTDGPYFRHPLQLEWGERSLRDGVWFVDVSAR